MYRKKFVPPLLKRLPTNPTTSTDTEPPSKKVKLETSVNSQQAAKLLKPESTASTKASKGVAIIQTEVKPASKLLQSQITRRPLQPISDQPPTEPKDGLSVAENGDVRNYYNVLWRKFQAKKHKTWDGDGVLAIVNGFATLVDVNGRDIGSSRISKSLGIGDVISIGSKEVEIDSVVSKEDFKAGKPFLKSKSGTTNLQEPISTVDFYAKPNFKSPLLSSSTIQRQDPQKPSARHDPTAENALVMRRPKMDASTKNKTIVDVVVDPFLSKHLRPHQREGVSFMYEAVMGMRQYEGQGAILADEMGLGKTLQTIALLWTLLKQNPVYGTQPIVKKAMIVCPVTIIRNWKQEFKKWLGNERIHVFVADDKSNIRDFTHGIVYNVMIVGYERLRNIQKDLQKCHIDIIIADEGHKMKTAQNKSAQAIRGLNTRRRIVLSGTPMQNNLSEFFVMVDFINPGILGNYTTFKKQFENPIVKSQQPEATRDHKELGNARKEELTSLTDMFILRRKIDIISKYLPPKTDLVVFCRPTKQQLELYEAILNTKIAKRQIGNMETVLQLITLLKKVCNSTSLLKDISVKEGDEEKRYAHDILEQANIAKTAIHSANSSGKIKVLEKLLLTLKKTTKEKIVLVSNYTSTLDVLEKLLNSKGYTHLRLDGKTPSSKRQDIVDKFNRVDSDKAFAFLLSSKSGGAGINLIGASRLVLFDSDWNPANDLQSMARVHRDGQKSHVFIYRMMTTGCIDEKIYQRQITKQGLADSVMDQKAGGNNFTAAELRDLFRLDTETTCNTHDLLSCDCGGLGELPSSYDISQDIDDEEDELLERPLLMKASEVDMDKIEEDFRKATTKSRQRMKALLEFSHIDTSCLFGAVKGEQLLSNNGKGDDDDERISVIEDDILREVVTSDPQCVSFIFSKKSLAAI